jgi:hypothetical protein
MDRSRLVSSFDGSGVAVALASLAAACTIAFAFAGSSRAADPVPGVKADFKWTPAVPAVAQSVTFESISQVTGVGNTIVSYRWDLDGDPDNGFEVDTGMTPSAVSAYAVRGQVEVRLRVRDFFGKQNTIKKTVTVAGQGPIAGYTFAPTAPRVNDPVTFTSTASDPDGTIAELVWDLNGDGSYDNGGGPTALRTFGAAGAYVVGLRATDDEGAISFYSQTIVVAGLPAPAAPLAAVGPPALRPLSPFPVVRIAGRLSRRGVRIKLLSIDAPPGAHVLVRCSGRSCPYKTSVRATSAVRLRAFERRLRAGVTIRIYVTSPNAIGKYTIFKIRKGRAPVRADACLLPRSRKPVACPRV